MVAGPGALPKAVCFAKGTGFPTGMPGVFYRTESVPPPHHLGQEGVFPRGQATEKSAPPQGHPGPLPPGQFDALPADTPRGHLHRACGQMTLRQVARGFPEQLLNTTRKGLLQVATALFTRVGDSYSFLLLMILDSSSMKLLMSLNWRYTEANRT